MNNPILQLNLAIEKIQQKPHIELLKKSSFYRTEPFGYKDQPDFINAVIEIQTKLSSIELLNFLQKIENQMGRVRNIKWGERLIDLDILLYAEEIIHLPHLQIPHPGITERLFVLIPLQEIAPDLVLPNGYSLNMLLEKFSTHEKEKISESAYN